MLYLLAKVGKDMNINQRLKLLREISGLTLEGVGKLVGVTKQTVQKYESGIVVSVSSDKIELLAEAYGVSTGYAMGWTDDPSIPKQGNAGNGDLMELREQLCRQPSMRILFDAGKGATKQDLLDAAALLERFKRRRDGEE